MSSCAPQWLVSCFHYVPSLLEVSIDERGTDRQRKRERERREEVCAFFFYLSHLQSVGWECRREDRSHWTVEVNRQWSGQIRWRLISKHCQQQHQHSMHPQWLLFKSNITIFLHPINVRIRLLLSPVRKREPPKNNHNFELYKCGISIIRIIIK